LNVAKAAKFFQAARNKYRFKKYYFAQKAVDLAGMSNFRGENFPKGEPGCWLDALDAEEQIEKRLSEGLICEEQAILCRFWVEHGYLIFPGLIDNETLDSVWAAYEAGLTANAFGPRKYVNPAYSLDDRNLDPHLAVDAIWKLQHHPQVLQWTDLLLGRKTVPFQTIMGHAGSQQAAHSDAIHMTTYPLGYLVANWIAFENISPNSGPLEYYPGSHKLPYILSADVGIPPNEFKQKGYAVYRERYEPAIARLCETKGFEKKQFLAKKGDVLLWHANLIHGGGFRADVNASRKAMVCHFFAQGAFTYHDLSGNPSRLHKNGLLAPITCDRSPHVA